MTPTRLLLAGALVALSACSSERSGDHSYKARNLDNLSGKDVPAGEAPLSERIRADDRFSSSEQGILSEVVSWFEW